MKRDVKFVLWAYGLAILIAVLWGMM